MTGPDWNIEGRGWPNRAASRFVLAGSLRWHVQVMGAGPPMLLLHGSGAATHSWRDLAPLLSADFTVIAPDLPGHGFTQAPIGDGASLPGMARSLRALLAALNLKPTAAVGHSAGAAIALRLALDDPALFKSGVVSLNGALSPFPGAAGHIFPVLAKLLFLNPVAIQLFAWRAGQPGAVAKLMETTGSHLDGVGLELYRRLMRTTGHVEGALAMMSRWNLEPLRADLGRLEVPLALIAAANDHAVPPRVAHDAARLASGATVVDLPNLGHLAHEEAPDLVARIIRDAVGARD